MATTIAEPSVLSTLHDLTQLLSSSLEPNVMLESIMDAVISATGAERGFLLLNHGKGMEVEVARNFQKEDLKDPMFTASHTVIEFVSETGTGQVIDDALTDNRTASSESVQTQQLRSIVCVPIKSQGDDVVGVVYLDHRGEPGHFTKEDMQLLEVIVHQAGVAIQMGRLHAKAQSRGDTAGDVKAYQDVILKSLRTAIVMLDTQGRVTGINPAAAELFDQGSSEAIQSSYRTVLGDGVSKQLVEAFKAALAGRSTPAVPVEAVVGGNQRWLMCAVSPLRDGDGNATGIIVFADDDTPRILAERARDKQLADHKRLRELFSKYVPEAVIDKAMENPGQAQVLGRAAVEQREVSVLFADIRGYTTFSERSSADRLLVTLTRYLTVASNCIMEQGGTLDKFMGDGVMALFNAPTDLPDHPIAAVRAASAMQKRATRFMEGVSFGVGVNTGQAFVGNIGTDKIRNYSCVGDVVNVASRLQGHAEGGNIVITRSTYRRIVEISGANAIRVKGLGRVHVKGREEPVEAIQVLAIRGEMDT